MILELIPFLREMLTSQSAETTGAWKIELKTDSGLETLVEVWPYLTQVLAGHLLSGTIQVEENPGLGASRCHLFFTNYYIARVRPAWITAANPTWVILNTVRCY